MDSVTEFSRIILLLLPLIILDVVFRIVALLDILKEERRVKGGNKIIWILVSVVINYGWVIYFIFGRDDV